MEKYPIRLGVNLDHTATLRNARNGDTPDLIRAARTVLAAGADLITFHLREDRRHIRDQDVFRLRREIAAPLNFEMAPTEEMVDIALKIKPEFCCLVPEKRQELTTEGGLDIVALKSRLQPVTDKLQQNGIGVTLFSDPEEEQIKAAASLGVQAIEFHTGTYAAGDEAALLRIKEGVKSAAALGIKCHAGHGLDFKTVGPVAAVLEIEELNIGFFLIAEALFIGLEEAVKQMKNAMLQARK